MKTICAMIVYNIEVMETGLSYVRLLSAHYVTCWPGKSICTTSLTKLDRWLKERLSKPLTESGFTLCSYARWLCQTEERCTVIPKSLPDFVQLANKKVLKLGKWKIKGSVRIIQLWLRDVSHLDPLGQS